MRRADVALVGGGFGGVALALKLLETGTQAPSVAVIDKSGVFGTGLAYSTPHPAHLLNVRAARMSASADEPADFADWLSKARGQEAPHEWFAPRAAYGAYLKQRLDNALNDAGAHAPVLISEEVVAIDASDDGAVLRFASGETLEARVVVLAWGNAPSRAPAPFDAGRWDGVVQHNPWDADALAAIPPAHDVLLIGTGLTMADIVLSLSQQTRTGRIFALSQRGLLPHPHAEAPRAALAPSPLPPALSDALRTLRREARAAEARGEPWQWTMDRVRPQTQALWRALSPEAQRRFLRHARPWWDTHRHRLAPHVMARIETLRDDGHLALLAGKLVRAKRDANGARVVWRPRGARKTSVLDVGTVINCTGPRHDLGTSDMPLVRQMLKDGLIRAHASGLGLDADGEMRVIAADGAPSPCLFAIGPPLIGAFWEATAVPEIRAHARALGDTVLAALATPRKSRKRKA